MDAKSNLFKLLMQIKVDGEDTQKASYQTFKTEEICDFHFIEFLISTVELVSFYPRRCLLLKSFASLASFMKT